MIDHLDHLKEKDGRNDGRLSKTVANGMAKLKSHSRGFQTRQNPPHSLDNGCLSAPRAAQINIIVLI